MRSPKTRRREDGERYKDDRDRYYSRDSSRRRRRSRTPEDSRHFEEEDQLKRRKTKSVEGSVHTKEADEAQKEKEKEAEQKKLEAEMEKRRQRVAAWQAQRRKANEEAEAEQKAIENEASNRKQWTLADEEEDEDDSDSQQKVLELKSDTQMDGDTGNPNGVEKAKDAEERNQAELVVDDTEPAKPNDSQNATEAENEEDDEIDPLDAFMNAEIMPEVKRLQEEDAALAQSKNGIQKVQKTEGKKPKKVKKKYGPYDSDSSVYSSDGESSEDDEEWAKNVVSGKGSKLEKLLIIDHSTIDYIPFRKNFLIEAPEISKMKDEEVRMYRKELDNIKVRGKNIPRPIKGWHQCGLSSRVMQVIKLSGFEKPMPIQAQALPVIMQGRDCIGIAKTGSGKTMAFVLPMLRHVKDQPSLKPGEGPIAFIMAPTRELVQQIGKDVKKFAKSLSLSLVCVYGGSGIASQITALKRGADIVVCTPGRMIDILAMGAGKITNMKRVTYFVLDEADRMFDLGFEPQITRIVNMIRPDRQTVMFSATFPRQVEILARTALTNPVEIVVGGRSIVNLDIEQIIEVRPEDERFLRLLELLGHWYERGKVLVFVHSQEKCDNLFRDLLRAGYPCMSLHGGKDQSDRECTINDFKSDVCNVLVATSVAARGLDVKDLHLVVNYDVPNHYEDYVHRVGRTGRAGNKGTAVTFIGPDEEKFAPDLVKALKESGQSVPQYLQEIADDFSKKCKQGLARAHGSGFGGSGFKFDEEEEKQKKMARRRITEQYGIVDVESSDSEDLGYEDPEDADAPKETATIPNATAQVASNQPEAMLQSGVVADAAITKTTGNLSSQTRAAKVAKLIAAAQAAAKEIADSMNRGAGDAVSRAAALAARLASQHNGTEGSAHFSTEIEINDFPQIARWKVTHKDSLNNICEQTGVAITTRGVYVQPGKQPREGERKLYLLIEGGMERGVKLAKAEIKKIIQESTEKTLMSSSRYQL